VKITVYAIKAKFLEFIDTVSKRCSKLLWLGKVDQDQ